VWGCRLPHPCHYSTANETARVAPTVPNGEDVVFSQPASINKSPGTFLRGSVIPYRAGALAASAGYRSPGVWVCATDGPLMVAAVVFLTPVT
jgi:hypothetical protein